MALFYERAYAEAVVELEAGAELESHYVYTGNWARGLYWLGERQRAEATYLRAIEQAEARLRVNPDDHDAQVLLAQFHSMVGNGANALEYIGRALEYGRNPEYFLIATYVYSQLGLIDEALDYLDQAQGSLHSIHEIRSAPELDDLRSQTRFREIVGR
jgi:tetratricopeptide (TPR) repeat protein